MTQKLSFFPVFSAVLASCFLFSCQEKTLDSLESFYFPLESLEEGLIYVFETDKVLDIPADVWYYQSKQTASDNQLHISVFDKNLDLRQVTVERRSTKGMIVDSVVLFLPDGLEGFVPVPANLLTRGAFPFFIPTPKEIITQKMIWVDPKDSLEYTYIKERKFIGINQSKDTISLSTRTELETFWVHDGTTTSEWFGLEKYVAGVGLVEYSKNFDSKTKMVYRLKGRYTMKEFLSTIE